jgi:hypothetical protein
MRRIGRHDITALLFVPICVALVVLSQDRWGAVAEGQPGFFFPLMPREGRFTSPELDKFKHDFLEAAGLLDFHHTIFERIGAERWEREVRPTVYQRLLGRMVGDTGILLPNDQQIIDWARQRPGSVREVLESYLPPEENPR